MTAPRRRLVLRHCVVALVVFAGVGVLRTTASADPVPAPWNLDRINQELLPLDGDASRADTLTGSGVDIYIIDSGIRMTHEQFGGRARYGVDYSRAGGVSLGYDCDGHGTHVAGIAGGSTVGVATGARLISVRVLDCAGQGDVTDVVKGLDWVRLHHRAGRLAIANLSLGLDVGENGTLINAAVRRVMADGVLVVIAAGNGDATGPVDACDVAPANERSALAVAATDVADAVATYSNYGPCVAVLAPGGELGQLVTSADYESDTAYRDRMGTSMASPLVAGYAALLAQQQPTLCPGQAKWAVINRATKDVVTGLDAFPTATANRLLFLNTDAIPGATAPGIPTNVQVSPDDGSVTISWDAPCNGLSPFVSWTIGVFQDGRLVRRVVTTTPWRKTKIYGLRNGVAYRFTVRAVNAIGAGGLSSTTWPVKPLRLTVGSATPTSTLFPNDGRGSLWSVRADSKAICVVRQYPQRLVALKVGTCKVDIFPAYAPYSTYHSFTIK